MFKNAETVLKQLVPSLHRGTNPVDHVNDGTHHFNKLYMIGDNPSVDIRGAQQVCLYETENLIPILQLR